MWSHIKKYYPQIIIESAFRVVQEERAKKSNIVTDDDGIYRSRKDLVEKKRISNQEIKMKTIVLNASPRKDWNTAKLLKSAMAGAESTGAEVEYINLYDLNFTGCRSCMLCKRKDVKRCHCYWKDDISPVIDKVFRQIHF